MANFIESSHNLKPAKRVFGFAPTQIFVLNKIIQTRFGYCFSEGFKFLPLPFGDELHSPIRQVSHCARDLKSCGHRLYGISKPDTLDVPRIKNLHPASRHNPHRSQFHAVKRLP